METLCMAEKTLVAKLVANGIQNKEAEVRIGSALGPVVSFLAGFASFPAFSDESFLSPQAWLIFKVGFISQDLLPWLFRGKW